MSAPHAIPPSLGTLRVLLVEDSEDDAMLLCRQLVREGYELVIERVDTAEAMDGALERQPWDIVIADWRMPCFSAPEALELAKSKDLDLPFIIVSGTMGEEAAVAAMRAGAQDYLSKDRLTRLAPAVARELREAEVRRERRKMQDRLMLSDRMASVGILAAGVGHEINNPLAAIVANLDVAMRDVAELKESLPDRSELGEVLEELHDARESVERIRDIVRDLRIFSRPDKEERRPVDVHKLLDSSLRMAWGEIRHRARVTKQYGSVPLVDGNESRLGQVFLNLIVNAAQSIAEGRRDDNEIVLSTRLMDDGRVLVGVEDTGSGIPPEVMKKLFAPFVTTKPIGVGTGLGLSICRRIVTSLGGEITVSSDVGKGTVFRVCLRPVDGARAPTPSDALPSDRCSEARIGIGSR